MLLFLLPRDDSGIHYPIRNVIGGRLRIERECLVTYCNPGSLKEKTTTNRLPQDDSFNPSVGRTECIIPGRGLSVLLYRELSDSYPMDRHIPYIMLLVVVFSFREPGLRFLSERLVPEQEPLFPTVLVSPSVPEEEESPGKILLLKKVAEVAFHTAEKKQLYEMCIKTRKRF
ncbi:UNVERIFIED_CONTAM: hypothetical protein FKN15_015224 [Acipenser sinensis]